MAAIRLAGRVGLPARCFGRGDRARARRREERPTPSGGQVFLAV